MVNNTDILLTPFNIGKEQIKNRFVVSPMGTNVVFDRFGVYTDSGIEYMTERAKGGWGLIYTGVMLVDSQVDIKMAATPLDDPRKFRERALVMNERANSYGTKVFAELGYGVGRNYPGFAAPSEIEVFGYPQMRSKVLSKEDIAKKEEQMIKAAALMKNSGYAGVDIHTLHWGYLLDEFVLAITNHREDEYGGSLDNRLRFVKETVQGIKQVCGQDFPVTIGLGVKSYIKALNKASLTGEEEAGRTLEESIEIAKKLEEMGFDAIMTDTGLYDSFYYACPPIYMPKGHALPLYEEIKKVVNIPVLARSKMTDLDMCAEAVESGKVDAIMMARQSLADPYLPRKVERGNLCSIRPCIGCNIGCIGSITDTGKVAACAVNPRAFDEINTRPKKALKPRKIAVVGGGPAGMEAARGAVECGHLVELFEKGPTLGGELFSAGAHDFKPEIGELREWYVRELEKKKVPVHLNMEFTADMLDGTEFDTVILAVGASPVVPKSIPGIEKAVTAVEHLEENTKTGENVVVVGAGVIGCETAVDLAKHGRKVTLVDMTDDILCGEFIPLQQKMMLRDMVEHYGVQKCLGHKLAEVTDNGVKVEDKNDQTVGEIGADTVILAMGMRPNASIRETLIGKGVEIYEIGSGRKNGNIINAIHEAFEVVYNFE